MGDGDERRARSSIVRPRRAAIPYSVTTLSTVFFIVVTARRGSSWATMREHVLVAGGGVQHDEALAVLAEHRAAGEVGLAAAAASSSVPPIISELHWPNRSTSIVALIDTKCGSRPMTRGSFTQSTGRNCTASLSWR